MVQLNALWKRLRSWKFDQLSSIQKREENSHMKLTNKTYDALKWIAQILLPALATLYFAIAAIWGLPAAEQVVGTIAAVDAFLGVLLGISAKGYVQKTGVLAATDGSITIDQTGLKDRLTFTLNSDNIGDLVGKKSVVFMVNKAAPPA
jgi:hypothetical protein